MNRFNVSPCVCRCKIQQFQELPLSLVATDAERVGLNAMSLAVRDESSDALPNDTRTLLDAVSRLGSQLDAAVEFVDKVLVRVVLRR